MNLLKGEPVAESIYRELSLKAPGFRPQLAILLVGNTPASEIYVRKKCEALEQYCNGTGSIHRFSEDVDESEILAKIQELNQTPDVHGIILQLPIPKTLDRFKLLSAIDPTKDVDGLSQKNLGATLQGDWDNTILPATPQAVLEIIKFYQISVVGKHVTIVNNSILVGKPLASMLADMGATVTVCHKKTENLRFHMTQADIVITAIGKPNFFRMDDIKQNAIVIDVGISKTPDGKTTGDFDQSSIESKAQAYTPVPGGVGPVTVASLLKNLY